MPDFDDYSASYADQVNRSVSFSGLTVDFFHRIKVDRLLALAAAHMNPKSASVLDVGCGTGSLARLVAPSVKELVGVDVSESSLETARREVPGGRFFKYDGERLPFSDAQYDLAFASCVMHHVPPSQWKSFSAEMYRCVRPGGLVAIIEHNPWNPLTRLAVSRCEFDHDAVLLRRGTVKSLFEGLGGVVTVAPFILFFPWRSAVFRQIERLISSIPLGAQYLVLVQKPLNLVVGVSS